MEESEFPPLAERAGIDAGIFVEWLDMPILSFITEAQYIQKGVTEGFDDFIFARPRVDYISVPILAKVRLSIPPFTDSQYMPYMIAGPRVDLLINEITDRHFLSFGKFKNIDYGASVGAGIEFSTIAPFRIDLEFRYSPNFTDSYTDFYTKVRNNSWELLLAVGM